MDAAVSFYNNLFTVEITVFGIIAAALFVFLQIVYTQFSYRETHLVFRNILLILYFVISTFTLLLTVASSFLLTFPAINLFLGSGIPIRDIISNWVLALFLLSAFLVSLILFVVFTSSNISYIRPSRIALLISKKTRNEQIRDYLLKKYGVPAPDDWLFLLRRYTEGSASLFVPEEGSGVGYEIAEEKQAKKERRKREAEKELSDNKKIYEKINRKVENAKDPLEPLDALMLRAINNVDLAAISEVQSVLVRVSANFVGKNKEDEDTKEWSPYSYVIRKYVEYLTGMVGVYLSLCDKQNIDFAKIRILEMTGEIARPVFSASQNGIGVLLDFWKKIGDDSIGKSREVFITIIELYSNVALHAFEKGDVDHNNCLNEIFKNLGWLGERLISQRGIETKPLMRDFEYSSEYDALLGALLTFGDKYRTAFPTSYPFIFFDAIDVVFRQLVPILKQNSKSRIRENVFDCLYTYSSFAEAAIPKRNARGAALAALRLRQEYEILLSDGLDDQAKEALKLLIFLGALAFEHKDTLESVEFLANKSLADYCMDIAVASPYRDVTVSQVRESYIRSDFSKWSYVLEMGKRLGTNFGFMFDWTTGELYPEDDPRRR